MFEILIPSITIIGIFVAGALFQRYVVGRNYD